MTVAGWGVILPGSAPAWGIPPLYSSVADPGCSSPGGGGGARTLKHKGVGGGTSGA